MYEIQCVITGKVQGVAYRAYTQDSATELGLTGWVENQDDQSVLVVAQGDRDLLKDFIEYLHEGSLRAEVATVGVDWHDVKVIYDDFSIKHT